MSAAQPTDLRLHEHEKWGLGPDVRFGRIGWIDQAGTIWKDAPNNDLPPFVGSLTPLLIPLDDYGPRKPNPATPTEP